MSVFLTVEVCRKCKKGDLYPGDFVGFAAKIEYLEKPADGQSLGDATVIETEFDDDIGGPTFPSCDWGSASPTQFHANFGVYNNDGHCRDRGRVTVTGTLCNEDPATGDCRFDKKVVAVREWNGEDHWLAPNATDDLRIDRNILVKICKDE